MTEAQISRKLQQVLDECGYIVIAHHSQHPIGACIDKVVDGHGLEYGVTFVVVGYTDQDDYLRQLRKYSAHRPDAWDYQFEFFHKVIAE